MINLLNFQNNSYQNPNVIEKARNTGVIMLFFAPHTTHQKQPLNASFMSPLTTYYTAEVQKWKQQHPGRPVTKSQIAKLFGTTLMRTADSCEWI